MTDASRPEAMSSKCVGKCALRWHHLTPEETEMVCLSCTLRWPVPPEGHASIGSGDGWEAWLLRAQETFERKVREYGIGS